MLLELFIGSLPALPAAAAYLCAGLLLFASGLGGIGVLQEVLLLALAAQALQGPLHAAVLAPLAWLAIVAGDAASLWFGRRYGARWIRRPWAARLVAPQRLAALEAGMRRWAALSGVLARWLPGQHGALCFIAGTLRAPWRAFLLADAAAAAVQVLLAVVGTRAFAWDWRALQPPLDTADTVLTLVLLAVLLAGWLRLRRPPS